MPVNEADLRELLRDRSADLPRVSDLAWRVEYVARERRQRRRSRALISAGAVLTIGCVVVLGISKPIIPYTDSAVVDGPTASGSAPSPTASTTAAAAQLLTWSSIGTNGGLESQTATTEMGYDNTTKQAVTITGWHIVDSTGATTGALVGPEPRGYNADFQPVDDEAAFQASPRSTVTIEPGQTIFVFLRIHPTCTATDQGIQPEVVLDLRAADGTTSQTVIHPLDGYTPGPGFPYHGWVSTTVRAACPT